LYQSFSKSKKSTSQPLTSSTWFTLYSKGPNSSFFISILKPILTELSQRISFHHCSFDISTLPKGKGYQEYLMINNTQLIQSNSSFIKLSGRYCFSNFNMIISQCFDSKNIVCTHDIVGKLTHSSIFYLPKGLSVNLFSTPCFSHINDDAGFYFEHALFESLRSFKTVSFNSRPCLIKTFRTGEMCLNEHHDFILKKLKHQFYYKATNIHSYYLRNVR